MSTRKPQQDQPDGGHDDVKFFGVITASVTHELNNVISIIEQTGGLLDDMVAGEEQGIPISTTRLGTVSKQIQKQTQRGLEIIRRLNHFAHATDAVSMEFDVNAMMANLIDLSRRLAERRNVSLDFQSASQSMTIRGQPFTVQRAVFGALMTMVDHAIDRSAITISCTPVQKHVEVALSGEAEVPEDTASIKLIPEIVDTFGGSLIREHCDDKTRFIFRIPGHVSTK